MIETIRQLAKSALPSGRTVRTLPLGIGRGLRMGVDFRSGQIGMYLGMYEVELNKYLKKLCLPGNGSFDIGGQMGYDALIMAKLSRAPVVTVECDSEWCDTIRHNAQVNPSLNHLLRLRQGYIDRADDPMTGKLTLDSLADETFVPKFVKIDIEGGEAAALQGADRLLLERPGFLIEVHSADLEHECDELLREKGYAPIVVSQRTWLPDYRPLEHNRWIVAE